MAVTASTPATVPTVESLAPAAPAAQPTAPRAVPALAPPAAPTIIPTSAPPPAATAVPLANTAVWKGRVAQFAEGTLEGTAVVADELRLAARAGGVFPASGTLLSPVYEALFPFDNVVLSWDARAPANTSLRFEVRASTGGSFTPWYVTGTWGALGGASERGQSDAFGTVEIDTLVLRRPATAWQYRVTLNSPEARTTPSLRLLALNYADMSRPLSGPKPNATLARGRDLPVPAYSQLAEDPAIAYKICSPTSLAMILNYYGQNKRVAEVAGAVRDQSAGIFGNWPLNTAYAASLGMEAHVQRFYSMDQIENEIAQGRPVAISIRFEPGELRGAPIPSTGGHLIVVRGISANGNVIVNDPMGADATRVRLVYDRQELERIWLRAGGVAYLVRQQTG